ncbi:SRPBCC domain-containing protein [Actinomycetes bacterium KLBMP 9759]
MSGDRIERETLIAASLDHVWKLVTEPGFWVGGPSTGTTAEVGDSVVAKNEHGEFPVRLEAVEPPTYVAFRWASAFPGEEPREDNSTLVEFTLTAEGDGVRLRVVESGFAAIVDTAIRRDAMRNNDSGWAQQLTAFQQRAEQ